MSSREIEPVRKGFSLEKPELKTKAQLLAALKGFIRESSSTHLKVILKDIQPVEVGLNLHFSIILVCLEEPFLDCFDKWGEHEFTSCCYQPNVKEPFYDRIEALAPKFFIHSSIDFNNSRASFSIEFPNSNFSFRKPETSLTSSRGALLNDTRIKFKPSFSLPFVVPEYREEPSKPEDDTKRSRGE